MYKFSICIWCEQKNVAVAYAVAIVIAVTATSATGIIGFISLFLYKKTMKLKQ